MTAATSAATVTAPRAASAERVGRVVHGGGVGGLSAISDAAACLIPLLNAISWHGTPRHLAEALPHFADTLDVDDLVRVLGNLDYPCRAVETSLHRIDPRLFPCIFAPDGGPTLVVYEGDGRNYTVLDGSTGAIAEIDGRGMSGTAYIVGQSADESAAPQSKDGSWFRSVVKRFRKQILQLLAITLVTNLLALAMPLFIMAVYDRVIGANSLRTLAFLLLGVALAIGCDLALRLVRARLLAYIGARIDMILGCAAFRQVINLPLIMTERATVGSQISRLKQFESVREFFTGQLAGVFLDLPFVGIFLLVIALAGGPIALIPLFLLAVFLGFGAFVVPATQGAVRRVGETRMRRQGFAIEMFTNLRAIKTAAAEGAWSERYRGISANCAWANFRAAQISVLVQTVAQTLMLSAGIATLAYGALRVLAGDMTVGALVACMILVWRVLVPLQVAFLSLTRFEQIKQGLQQLDQLMRLESERTSGEAGDQHRSLTGQILFHRVSLRYAPTSEPALLGVDLQVEPGEVVAITGSNGAGKSTILKLVAGLYQSQAGAVLIDGMDLRQLDPGELRWATASVPQSCDLFHGTIAQNLRLANPTASDEELVSATHDAAILDEILTLPEGFETRLNDRMQRQLSNGFKQGLMLARAYVKDAPIYLLDEPGNHLDAEGDRAFMRKLDELRGRATVIVVTHRPSHLRLADRVVVMDAGRILLNGPPGEVLPQLMA
jgi:ATP-binding cassette subfamily C protein/ATP-binding cassette subfamily C protein LapB